MIAAPFLPLEDGDCPTRGLFFLDDLRSFESGELFRRETDAIDARTAGMAFLVSPEGLVATCAHVLTGLDLVPGDRTTLFCAAEGMPFLVDAQVEESGWLGPSWYKNRGRPRSPTFGGRPDLRPDVVREDLAFLRIIPGSERLHRLSTEPSARPARSDGADNIVAPPVGRFREMLRVLPLGAPGYQQAGAELRCWAVDWHFATPTAPMAATGHFVATEPAAHRLVRFIGEKVRPGYSGSPLWDERRRLVVGMVRSERFYTEIGERSATDSRALLVRTEISLSVDSVLLAIRRRAMERVEQMQPVKHADLTGWADPRIYVEPRVQLAGTAPPDANSVAGSLALPTILDALFRERQLLVFGAAGMGKSVLAARLAAVLAQPGIVIDDSPIVPLLISAAELAADGFSFDAMVARLSSEAGQALPDRTRAICDALGCNGAKLCLLVDGLDEVSDEMVQRILQFFSGRSHLARANAGMVAGIVLFTRPMSSVKTNGQGRLEGNGRAVLELLPFDSRERDQLVSGLYPDTAHARTFRTLLDDASWNTAASPLQILMASLLFDDGQITELPRRPLDLPAAALDVLIKRGCIAANMVDEMNRTHATVGLLGALAMRTYGHVTADAASDALVNDADFGTAAESDPAGAARAFLAKLGSLSQAVTLNGDLIAWVHRSFAEAAAAGREVARRTDDAALVNRIGAEMAVSHHMTLVLLAAAERAGRFEAVKQCLERSIAQPLPVLRPHLLVVRALAGAIDANGMMRRAQLKLLLQIVVSQQKEDMACRHIFMVEGLPDPIDILERPALREDVIAAFRDRLASRLHMSMSGRSAKLLDREFEILRRLDMLVLFPGLESPNLPNQPDAKSDYAPTVEIALGSQRKFLSGERLIDIVRSMNEQTSGRLHSRDLLNATLRIIMLNASDVNDSKNPE